MNEKPKIEEPRESSSPRKPELLSPAGDRRCAEAAVAEGADAVYFGLATATHFNARSRAKSITLEDLPTLVADLHRHGVKGYVTLNTLVFSEELEELEGLLRLVVEAGVDAVIVQDIAVARLAQAVCPTLPLHASTQMSLTSAEGIHAAQSLGIQRVILARELSIDEIRLVAGQTPLELEVFVHGAICISYSGQCLASRTLGQRSANRGDCAQLCRLEYQLTRDGESIDLDQRKYLLSPLDLAAYRMVPDLVSAGISALKIEGRLKTPDYVALVTRHYRKAIDAAVAGKEPRYERQELRQLEAVFSRGFSEGWLRIANTISGARFQRAGYVGNVPHDQRETLMPGWSSSKRGLAIGKVTRIGRSRVAVELTGPLTRGDGVVFGGNEAQGKNVGGRVLAVHVAGKAVEEPVAHGLVELAFARDLDVLRKIHPGDTVWKTDDSTLQHSASKTFARRGEDRCEPLDLVVEGTLGQPLRVSGRAVSGAACNVESSEPLREALKHPLTESTLRQQLGRLGGSGFRLQGFEMRVDANLMLPLSVLGRLRREMVAALTASVAAPPRVVATEAQLPGLRGTIPRSRIAPGIQFPLPSGEGKVEGNCPGSSKPLPLTPTLSQREREVLEQALTDEPRLHVLCRTAEQLDAAIECGARSVIADYREIAEYRRAVQTARSRGAEILLATTRIQKPGEAGVFQTLAGFEPDGVLVRNLGALEYFARQGILAVADFSLNAANELTVDWLGNQGARRVTACLDLGRRQLLDLVAATLPEQLEMVVHLHVPMFHSEYCLFRSHFSQAENEKPCGRPCDQHAVGLQDRMGAEHRVSADGACRNTIFHAIPQSAVELLHDLSRRGVRHFRVELLDESRSETTALLGIYQAALSGKLSGADAWRRLQTQCHGRLTRGTLR